MVALPKIFRLDTGSGDYIGHRNASASAFCEPVLTLVEAAAVLFGDRLIVGGSCSQCSGHRIGHDRQEMADGGELAGIKLIKQPMCVLFVHAPILAPASGGTERIRTTI